MSCSCCTSIADGTITQSEHNNKVFNLQCRFKDYVASITSKWRYGIFCPEDSDSIIELRALLRLLICYGKETEEIPGDSSAIPECYNDYITYNGIDLNAFQAVIPPGTGTNVYFLITSPYTGAYYILQSTAGYYSGEQELSIGTVIFSLDQGLEVIQFGNQGNGGSYFVMEVLCSGNQIDLDNALAAAEGVTISSSGIPDSDLITIVQRIEKLLAC